MGRAGIGSGGVSSGGGRSSSRSGGGHRVGGSSSGRSSTRAGQGTGVRAGSAGTPGRTSVRTPGRTPVGGTRGGTGRGPSTPPPGGPRGGFGGPGGPRGGFRGPGMPPPPPPRRSRPVYRGGRRSGSNSLGCLVAVIVMLAILFAANKIVTGAAGALHAGISSASGSQTSTITRNKIDTDNAYINDCIIDELGWFDNITKTESRLKEFWEETGVQPYIILKDYDPAMTTDAQKEQWAFDYYDANFTTENIFLYVYFAEEDTDNDVGYMYYVNGKQTSTVMDPEAIEIFWNNIDEYWYTDLSTDDLFVSAFTETASTIMHMPTTSKDILKWALIVAAVIVVGVILIVVINKRHKRAKEVSAEKQRILNTPVSELTNDELTNKYL